MRVFPLKAVDALATTCVLAVALSLPAVAQETSAATQDSSTPASIAVQPTTPGGAPSGVTRPVPAIPLPTKQDKHEHIPEKYDVNHIGQRGIGSGINFYSLEKEQALGPQLAQEVEQGARLISDPVVNEYVNRVGQNIVRNSDAKVPFTIKVIDDDTVNAFALPGGFFYVNSGLILAAENEAELAGVMAHEIAHVAARHATKQATKGQIINLASIPLIFIGGPAGYAVRQAAGLAVPMGFLKFSRDAEREADLLGLEYAYATGYDPAEFVHFFETLRVRDKKKISTIAKAFSTHPMTDDRIKRAQNEIQDLLPSRDEYIVTTSEFDSVKARLAAIVNRGRLNAAETDKPTLRRRTNDTSKDKDSKDGKNDGRPTLRRRTSD
jgi:predicted Zn-dependent protease